MQKIMSLRNFMTHEHEDFYHQIPHSAIAAFSPGNSNLFCIQVQPFEFTMVWFGKKNNHENTVI